MNKLRLVTLFNQRLHDEISITRQMGIQIKDFDGFHLSLSAPIVSNCNDKRTAFAGSLYSACVLSGWSLVTLILEKENLSADVMVYKSNINNIRPVYGDIVARSNPLEEVTVRNFVDEYYRNAKAKIEVSVSIYDPGGAAVEFAGKYVAIKRIHN